MLRAHMPELAATSVVELAGADLVRMLSLYKPPPYLAACSQGVWTREGAPMLVRNYDYAPSRFEGLIWSTRLLEKRVIGMTDCLWGLLDGMNDDGLAVSLTFGGRRVLGDGFGIPIVMRYLLETCSTIEDARVVLARLPYSLSHNLTLVDASGAVLTAYLSPDREPIFRAFPAATNHQGIVEWPEQARATRTISEQMIAPAHETIDAQGSSTASCARRFSTRTRGFGTCTHRRTGRPEGVARFIWPAVLGSRVRLFIDGDHTEVLAEPTATSAG
jgi:predicted choloylglycine hydrolase